MILYDQLSILDQYLEKCIDEGVAAGMNIALITKKEKWFKSYGYRQIVPNKVENDLATLWDLASISKVLVTTTCIVKLIEEGLITLDSKLHTILPLLLDKELTIKECLTHTSGYPADISNYKLMTKEEMISALFQVKKQEQFINKVNYSDINFMLLGKVVDTLKGSLASYADEVIFKPLNMKNSGYNPDASWYDLCAAYEEIEARGGLIRGTVHDGKAHVMEGISGHAGVFSTLKDISHFVTMMINDGVYQNKRFFSKESMHLLTTCHTEETNEKRSLGWIISDEKYALGTKFSDVTLFHTGFSGPSVLIDLKKKVACVILCNRVHPTRENKKILTERNNIHNLVYNCIRED